jgi:sugar lactone lactonase YvrE
MMTRSRVIGLSCLAVVTVAVTAEAAPSGRGGATVSALVAPTFKGATIHGMNGVGWGAADGMVYVISDLAGTIYSVDPRTGEVKVAVPFPLGEGDDVIQHTDGALAWTATSEGELRYRKKGGKVEVLAHDVPRINPVAFRADGRVVASQVGTAPGLPLFEVDPKTKVKRIISTGQEEMNSFSFGPDGLLYGPAIALGKVLQVNVDTNERKILAEGFSRLASVKWDPRGHLIALESRVGHVSKVDPKSGRIERLVTLPPLVDNTAQGTDSTIYVSSPPDSTVWTVNPDTKAVDALARGWFSGLGGLAIAGDTMFAADDNTYRTVNLTTGEVTRRPYKNDPAQAGGGSNDIAVQGGLVAVSRVRGGLVQVIEHASEKLLWESKEIKTPYGILFADDNAVLVADYEGGRVARVDAKGASTVVGGLKGPVGLAQDGPDHVLVTERTGGAIQRIEVATGRTERVARGLSKPEGIVVLADGRIAVVEAGQGRVSVVTRRGRSGVVARGFDFDAQFTRAPEAVGFAAGLVPAKDGTLYVSADGDSSIWAIKLPSR